MINHSSLSHLYEKAAYIKLFDALAGHNLLLEANPPLFTILAATSQRLQDVSMTKEAVIGKALFEAHPGNSTDPTDNGVSNLRSSLDHVLRYKEIHQLPAQRYDLPDEQGGFSEKYWRASNRPVLNEAGEVAYIIHTAEDITHEVKSNQMAEKMKGMEQAYNLFRQTPIPICIFKGPELIIELANKPTLQLWGRTEEVIGLSLEEAIPEVKGQGYVEMINKVRETGITNQVYESPVTLVRNGKEEVVYINYIYEPYYEEGQAKAVGVLAIGNDVTVKVLAKKEVEQSQQDLQNMVLQAPIGICVMDAATLVNQIANDKFLEIAGRPLNEVVGWMYWDTFNEAKPYYEDALNKVIRQGITFHADEVKVPLVRYGKKELVYVTFVYEPLKNSDGVVKKVAVWVLDNTPQVMVRRKVEESEAKLRSILNSASTAICVFVGPDLILENPNQLMMEVLAAGPDIEGKSFREVLSGLVEEDQKFIGLVDTVRSTGQLFEAQEVEVHFKAEKKTRYFNISFIPLYNGSGAVYAVLDVSVDVTEQVLARKKLEEKEAALEAALEQVRLSKEAAELGTFDMDLERGDMHWDKRCRALFGISHNHPVSFDLDFIKRLHPNDQERVAEVINRAFDKSVSNGNYDVEYRTIGAGDGAERWVRAKGKVYFNAQEKPVRFIGSVLDITEQKTAIHKIESLVKERTRELAQANESLVRINTELQRSNQNLEEFAHAASHDLKEPVRKILFFTHQLREQLSEYLKESELRSFSRIKNATERMGNLIDDLLLYSHVSHRPPETEAVDLNEAVHRVMDDLELDIEEKKAVIYVEKLPVVQGYRRQLQQLFQNLLSNALKYSKADEPPRIDVTTSVAIENDQAYNVISVKDNGIGFDQQYAEKIFQMFSRLHGKAEYSGTGVGLSIAKKVVQNHSGFIRVESDINKGSVFKIYLPVQVK